MRIYLLYLSNNQDLILVDKNRMAEIIFPLNEVKEEPVEEASITLHPMNSVHFLGELQLFIVL